MTLAMRISDLKHWAGRFIARGRKGVIVIMDDTRQLTPEEIQAARDAAMLEELNTVPDDEFEKIYKGVISAAQTRGYVGETVSQIKWSRGMLPNQKYIKISDEVPPKTQEIEKAEWDTLR